LSTFHTQYISTIEPAIRKLDAQRKTAAIAGFICRIFELFFITVVVSLFLGFLNMFNNQEEAGGGLFGIIKYFMYAVLSLVIIGIIYTQVKKRISERDPKQALNNGKILIITFIFSAIALAGGYLIGVNFLGSDFDMSFMLKWFLSIASVFVMLLPYRWIKSKEDSFTNKFKEELFKAAIPGINPNITYEPETGLTQSQFIASKLFTYQEIHTFKSRDYFANQDSTFVGSYLDVMQVERKQSNGKSETTYSQLFKGYFFIADFNKMFTGETFVFPDSVRNVFGGITGEWLNELIHRPALKLALMEDPIFEKYFAVYTSDEVEARYILSPKLIERITAMKEIFYEDIHIAFIENKLYFAISSVDDFFAPGVFTDLHSETEIEKMFNKLQSLILIPERFDLSTRIWK
jgi:Protein of unknown function (DUF3137)